MPYNPEDRGCATCRYGDFPRTKSGRKMRGDVIGKCLYTVPAIVLPLSVSMSETKARFLTKYPVWSDYTDCPTWAAPDGGGK